MTTRHTPSLATARNRSPAGGSIATALAIALMLAGCVARQPDAADAPQAPGRVAAFEPIVYVEAWQADAAPARPIAVAELAGTTAAIR